MEQSDSSPPSTDHTSSESHPRTSTAYPAGQGDFTFITIDNVIFHIDRAIMRYSSHVFEVIFEREDVGEGSSPLKIEADAVTFEHLLTFAHPNKPSPSIDDIHVLAALFRAAKRYEMDGVLHQLRKSLFEFTLVDDAIVNPWFQRAPLAVLVIAHAFDCTIEARHALRECLKGSLEVHIAGAANFDIPAQLLAAVVRMRQERIDLMVAKIDGIQHVYATNCFHCGLKQGDWRYRALRALQSGQPLDTLKAISNIGNCGAGHIIANRIEPTIWNIWMAEVAAKEGTLPFLPQTSR